MAEVTPGTLYFSRYSVTILMQDGEKRMCDSNEDRTRVREDKIHGVRQKMHK